uniref:Reverse transcriptase domain-containing protein n=1 Tax=Cannabis sativa TaxID=3483 RepID=A0A803QIZ4_CANSA
MAIKLDMSKAYDRVEWDYLREVMSRMGFHSHWIDLVMHCVTTVCYNVIHDGHVIGPIHPTRGIRQGDPLSTYLFIICADGLSTLIQQYEANRIIHGCRVARGAPPITHMLFADDSYLFCQATNGAAEGVMSLLHSFEQASGQQVNVAKSSVFFSPNIDNQSRTLICSTLQMSQADEGSLYLGLPNIIGRNKSAIFGFLKNKVMARMNTWEGKFLSRAGKEILLKTVIQSLPTYAMSVFLIPIGICEEIEKLMASFWWKTSSSKGNGIIWMSWNRLGASKDDGGMGFRHLHDFNLAMLAKQGCRMLCNHDTLVSRIFKAKYFPHSDFLLAKLGNNPRFVWRSIWGAQHLVKKGAIRTIGNGASTNILTHPWLPSTENKYVSSTHPGLISNTVSSLFFMDPRTWDVDIIRDLFPTQEANIILGLPLSPHASDDCWSWSNDSKGCFTVKSAYNLLQDDKHLHSGPNNSGFWRKLWQLKIPPKVKNFLWRASNDCLPTCLNLVIKHVNIDSRCPVCKLYTETVVHALISCPFAHSYWTKLGPRYVPDVLSSFGSWLDKLFRTLKDDQVSYVAMVCWALWNARNNTVWKDKSSTVSAVLMSAKTTLDHWKKAQDNICLSSIFFDNKGDGAELWTKPDNNHIKINVDAALFPQEHSYGYGIVARDSTGHLIEAKTGYFEGNLDASTVEALSIKEALSWIKSKNWQNVEIESDSMISVQGIRGNQVINSLSGLILHDCQILLSSLPSVSLRFIRRSANRVAHVVARYSRFLSGRSIFEYNVWSDCESLLYSKYL